jgi:hypothetical protein
MIAMIGEVVQGPVMLAPMRGVIVMFQGVHQCQNSDSTIA